VHDGGVRARAYRSLPSVIACPHRSHSSRADGQPAPAPSGPGCTGSVAVDEGDVPAPAGVSARHGRDRERH
jgi:hypothetical protein